MFLCVRAGMPVFLNEICRYFCIRISSFSVQYVHNELEF